MKPLEPDDFYLEHGKFVLTERFHLRRGYCCGNACRHCPFEHGLVAADVRAQKAPPYPYFASFSEPMESSSEPEDP